MGNSRDTYKYYFKIWHRDDSLFYAPLSNTATSQTQISDIYIDNTGETYVDGQPVKTWAIQGKLRDMLRASTEKSVLVVTDDSIAVEKLIDVVDQCRLSGAKDVAVATKKEVG